MSVDTNVNTIHEVYAHLSFHPYKTLDDKDLQNLQMVDDPAGLEDLVKLHTGFVPLELPKHYLIGKFIFIDLKNRPRYMFECYQVVKK